MILDNGVYENELVTGEQLIDLVEDLRPTYTVLPDVPNDFLGNELIGGRFLATLGKLRPTSWMKILHAPAGNHSGFVAAAANACNAGLAIGLSRLTHDFGVDFGRNRAKMLRHLQHQGLASHYVHAFGWGSSFEEARQLSALGCNSMDTSAPIWRGTCGISLQDGPWLDVPFDVDYDSYEDWELKEDWTKSTMCKNLQKLEAACSSK